MLKLFLVLVVALSAQINAENVPVFLWGSKTPTYFPTLKHLEGDEFVTLVKSQADKDSLTVLFVENNLSVEDFSQCKLRTKTCFENLQSIPDKTFLNSVQDPVESLIASYSNKKSISLSSEDDLRNVDAQNENILIVNLDNVVNPEDFDKHDELMKKLIDELKSKYGNVVAVYTGRNPSFKYSETLSRKAREAAEEKPAPVEEKTDDGPVQAVIITQPKQEPVKPLQEVLPQKVISSDPRALLAISEVWIEGENVLTEAVVPTLLIEIPNQEAMNVTLVVGTHNLVMDIVNTTGRWEVSEFRYQNERYYPRESTVWGISHFWSFGCSKLTLQSPAPNEQSSRKTIQLVKFQFQPSWETAGVTAFGPCYDCIGFFSAGIWGGLFVVFILVLILFYGLSNMMDIRTMDRFDDPKGKTITVNTQE